MKNFMTILAIALIANALFFAIKFIDRNNSPDRDDVIYAIKLLDNQTRYKLIVTSENTENQYICKPELPNFTDMEIKETYK